MEYARLGRSEVAVSRIIFGAWVTGGWMWGGVEDEESIAAIRKAVDLGITTIDTAPVYGFGHSERIVGEAIKGRREDVVIATKCGLRWDTTEGAGHFETVDLEGNPVVVVKSLKYDSVLGEIDGSLERLGVDYVDLYQCHWPDPTTPIKETIRALSRILDEGKARAIGMSNFTPEMIEEALRYAPVASDQPLYNMLDRGTEQDVLPFCAENEVGVIVYSPLHQGLLTGKVSAKRTFPEGDQRNWKPWFQPRNRKRVLAFLKKLGPIAAKHGKTLAQVAANWCLCRPGVTAAIVGARRPEQVEENAGAAGWKLDDEDLAQIRACLDGLGEPE
jgi:aryl-alcohol dehydrogenase-like predicted oxidoreductase